MGIPEPKKVRGVYEKFPGSGVWWIRWADGTGSIHREKAGTRAAAGILYRKRKTEVLQGRKLPETMRKKVLTVGDLLKRVRQHAADEKDYSDRYRAVVRQQAVKMEVWWGDLEAVSLAPSEIQARLAAYAKSPATFYRYKATLSLAYRLALKDRTVDVNPARAVSHQRENNARIRHLSDNEETKLRTVIQRECPEREAEFDLALYTGMRRSEQYGILWRNVDFAGELIFVPRSKHGSSRYLRITAPVRRALQTLLQSRNGDDSPVCPGGMSRSGYRDRWFFECAVKANLSDVVFHALRHTYISRAVMRGIDIRTVQELAGHKTIQMTMRYAHIAPHHLREAADRVVAPIQTSTAIDTSQSTEPPTTPGYLQ